MQVAQQHAGARDGKPRMHFQAGQFFERQHPAAERDARPGDARTRTSNGDCNAGCAGLAKGGRHRGLVRRNDHPLGVSLQPGGVLQIPGAYTSRITGMIIGRRDVAFIIWRFRSARIFSFITPQSVFSS